MNKAIPFALCAALAACASPAAEAPAPDATAPEASAPEIAAPQGTNAIAVDRPEVRYYVISDG